MNHSTLDPAAHVPRLLWGATALGFGAAGFFDGIILHQILQWHHLLSSLTVGVLGSLRAQVAFDGLFHAVMYVIAAIGIYLIFRHRRALAQPLAARQVQARFLIGFGTWHIVDAVVSHWVTGIHRIRMDVNNPLAWDIGWLLIFGIAPILLARYLNRRSNRDAGHPVRLCVAATAATVLAGGLNAYPVQADAQDVTVVLRHDRSIADIMPALDEAGAGIVWSDPSGAVWVLRGNTAALSTSALYRNGALFVSTSLGGAACGTWFE